MATIYTVGHGARGADDFSALLKDAGITTLVDVRAFPSSRRNPQYSRPMLSESLARAAIAYHWQGRALGGYRKVPYPEHMKTALFREAAAALPDGACIMCAETNPGDCHRLHIADWLTHRGHRVVHLLAPGSAREHTRNPQEELWRDD